MGFFSEEEEEEPDTIFNLQQTHNTRSKGPPSQESSPLTQAPSKGKNQTQKDTLIPEPEYNLVEDLKRVKANISLFDLLKIPSIRDSLPKIMIIKKPREIRNTNIDSTSHPNHPKLGSKGTPPFLLTFEIFNRNVHNCMVDSGVSSNAMPLSVCKKLNATWENCHI